MTSLQTRQRPAVPTLAALDLGTNNCRLLLARPRGAGFVVIDSFSRIVRLGEGVATSGVLSEAAQERTITALRACARMMDRRRVERQRCVATEACRRAANGRAFLDRVRATTGLHLEILDAQAESRLALLGCAPLIEADARHVLVLDIGGGSTELFWLERLPEGGAVSHCAASIPLGVVGLAERFGETPDDRSFEAVVATVMEPLARLEAAFGIGAGLQSGRVQTIGTSGTVTTLAALLIGLERYDRRRVDGLTVDIRDIREVASRLRAMSCAERAAHGCIGPGRADLVVAGCAILEAVQRVLPSPRLTVADRGLREGILHELAGGSLETSLPPLPLSA